MRRYGIPLLLVALAAVGLARDGALSAAGASGARLTAISATADGPRATLLIEASEPVAYVTTQPDPSTLLVDLRNVTSAGYANGLGAQRGAIKAVKVEDTVGALGEPVARVRLALATPVAARVRSQRNLIFVDLDSSAQASTAPASAEPSAGASAEAAAMTRLTSVRAVIGREGVSVMLAGDGPLVPGSIQPADGLPHRLVLDFPNVTPSVPGITPVNKGPIDRVRVALHSRKPLVTRVVVDMIRDVAHRVESVGDGRELRVRFLDDGATGTGAPADPVASLALDAPKAAAQAAAPSEPAARAVQAPAVPSAQAAPAPAAPATQEAAVSRAGDKAFTGHPVSLDFQGADLRAVLRTFAEISGFNIVIDPAVQGSVDVSLRDVPWDQALDIILRANKLGYFHDGTIVRVAPLSVLADEEKQRRRLSEEQALSGELRVVTKTLSYAKAEDVSSLITKSALSMRGTVQVDARTNTLIISDLQASLDTALSLINTLDQPQPQVEIEARIVQTTRDFARSIGVQWGVSGRMTPELGNTTGLQFPSSGSVTGRQGSVQGPGATPSAVSLGVPAASSALGLALGSVNGAFNLDVALSALERSGNGRLLSTPRVSTQNNVEAEITQGVQIPIQTVANNTVTVTFKDAALTLKVTPQITSANTVIMRIVVENAAPDYSRAVGTSQIPPIDTQRAITQVLVLDGQTTVIGGIYVSREQAISDRTPGLHRVPLLGWLFKRNGMQDESRELLIFVTPKIIRS